MLLDGQFKTAQQSLVQLRVGKDGQDVLEQDAWLGEVFELAQAVVRLTKSTTEETASSAVVRGAAKQAARLLLVVVLATAEETTTSCVLLVVVVTKATE